MLDNTTFGITSFSYKFIIVSENNYLGIDKLFTI